MKFGYSMAWVLVFATAAVFVLQSFTAATGILARQGLAEALRNTGTHPAFAVCSRFMVVLGLWVGCASFELGNLAGAASGLQSVVDSDIGIQWYVVGLAVCAGVLLLLETKILLRVLGTMVAVMGAVFLACIFVTPIDWAAAAKGMLVPSIPEGSLLTVVALIGTTVVTYNLFLHASTTREFWKDEPDTRRAWVQELKGMAIFIPIGGVISLAILLCGATLAGTDMTNAKAGDFAILIEPVAGRAARYMFGLGLLGAGLTSAVTAPLAAAAGISELFAWKKNGTRFRLVWLSVLLTGVLFGTSGYAELKRMDANGDGAVTVDEFGEGEEAQTQFAAKDKNADEKLGTSELGWSPLAVIVAAQAANGVLLPFVAAFMLFLTLRQKEVRLPGWYTALGVVITLICAGFGYKTLAWVWSKLG